MPKPTQPSGDPREQVKSGPKLIKRMGSPPPAVRCHFPRRTLLRDLMHANIYFVNLYIFAKWASLVAQMVKELAYNAGDPGSIPRGKIPWRREWQPTPVFLPREFHGQRSLVGYGPWGSIVRHDWATNTLRYMNRIKCLNLFLVTELTPQLHLWWNIDSFFH